MKKKLFYEVREFATKEPLTNTELDNLIIKMKKLGFDYEGINPNNDNYSFIKFNRN